MTGFPGYAISVYHDLLQQWMILTARDHSEVPLRGMSDLLADRNTPSRPKALHRIAAAFDTRGQGQARPEVLRGDRRLAHTRTLVPA